MRVWKNYGCINGTELARKRKRRIGGIVQHLNTRSSC